MILIISGWKQGHAWQILQARFLKSCSMASCVYTKARCLNAGSLPVPFQSSETPFCRQPCLPSLSAHAEIRMSDFFTTKWCPFFPCKSQLVGQNTIEWIHSSSIRWPISFWSLTYLCLFLYCMLIPMLIPLFTDCKEQFRSFGNGSWWLKASLLVQKSLLLEM